jgi:hypothetical protein
VYSVVNLKGLWGYLLSELKEETKGPTKNQLYKESSEKSRWSITPEPLKLKFYSRILIQE